MHNTEAQCAGPDHTVLCCSIVQHVLWCSPPHLCSALLVLIGQHSMQHATCSLLLCSATDHTDVCTPVSGADGVLRPSLLGRQWHCQCLNLSLNASPQCHQTAPAQTSRWHDVVAQSMCTATTNVSASLLVDCHKSDPGLVVGGVTTLSIRWYCTRWFLCSCHLANYTSLLHTCKKRVMLRRWLFWPKKFAE